MITSHVLLIAFVFTILQFDVLSANAQDWRRYRGPAGNGVSAETNWTHNWPASGPTMAWEAEVGTGYSSVVVADGRLFTMGNRDNVDTVYCFNAVSGRQEWQHSYKSAIDPNEFEGGPTSTPTIDGEHVYTLSRTGELYCFEYATGVVVWSINVATDADVRIPGWGFSGSPWVSERLVILNVGDAGIAVNKSTGEIVWASADKDAGYSSLVRINAGGRPRLVFGSARSYVCIDPITGKEQWRQRWLTTFGCNAADPIVWQNRLFLSSGYNRGSALLDTSVDPPTVIWKNKEFQTQISTGVKIGDFVYGANGDIASKTKLTCLALETGKIMWTEDSIDVGGILAADDRLIVIETNGRLSVVSASSESAVILAQHQVMEGQCWTMPVLCGGRIYCRNSNGRLICLDVRSQRLPIR